MENYLINQATHYVNIMYPLEDLTLTMVSSHCGVHPSHLSRTFRSETGECFTSYLNSLRLSKAVALAMSGELMYVTAEKIGFSDPYYFGRCYKKYFGVNYSEFSRICRESGLYKA